MMNAQISFLDGTFTLIHIPLDLYPSVLQPIIRVLIPQTQSLREDMPPPSRELDGLTDESQHHFLNVSVTPLECSIVCHTSWAKNVFKPVIDKLPKDAAKAISISADNYLVMSVISAGMDAASRVMELTSPLALAGVSIFFITTYYSDFILVPEKAQHAVTEALAARGFQLAGESSDYRFKGAGAGKQGQAGSPPSTPPPSTMEELENRTFKLLKDHSVVPDIVAGLHLVQCSGREMTQLSHSEFSHHQSSSRRQAQENTPTEDGRRIWLDNVDPKLYTAMVSAFASQPHFLSVTLAKDEPPSLLLDSALLPVFGDSLVGDTEGKLVPIFLNLSDLPFGATGIVCGVAGKLVEEMEVLSGGKNGNDCAGLSYLSTARAGAVIVSIEQAERASIVLDSVLKF